MFDHDYFSMQTGYHEYKVFLFKHFCVNGAKNNAKKILGYFSSGNLI